MATSAPVRLSDCPTGMNWKRRRERGKRMWQMYRRENRSVDWIRARFKVEERTVWRWVARFDEAEGNLIEMGMIQAEEARAEAKNRRAVSPT